MKENKYYSPLSFWLPLAYMVVLGLFFTEESRYSKVLHREQTDEWKGIITLLKKFLTPALGQPLWFLLLFVLLNFLFYSFFSTL